MSTETEIKVKIQDPEHFCEQLQAFKPRIVSTRHFEDNRLLDFPDKTLMLKKSLIRIRQAAGKSILTFKGPPEESEVLKVREELETGLSDGDATLQICERLGLRECFRYQKYRREFEVDGVIVAVDETPIGNYAELEGPERAIYDLAGRMGLEESLFVRHSYYSLYVDYCRLKGESPGNMVFNSEL